jgi:hypothetical protein
MKKLSLFLFAFIAFCSCPKSTPSLVLADIQGNQCALMMNLQPNNTFTDYYIFQYSTAKIFDVTTAHVNSLITATTDMLKMNVDGHTVTFTVNPGYTNPNETIYYGYGLQHTHGPYVLALPTHDISTFYEAISLDGSAPDAGETVTCHSGGQGATGCSVTSAVITGGSGCSVKCGAGYYACCDDTKNECPCIKYPPTKTPTRQPVHLSKR